LNRQALDKVGMYHIVINNLGFNKILLPGSFDTLAWIGNQNRKMDIELEEVSSTNYTREEGIWNLLGKHTHGLESSAVTWHQDFGF